MASNNGVVPSSLEMLMWGLFSRIMEIVIAVPLEDRRGRDRMVVGFITTYAISVYHH
jgi:hypothetical protein